MRPHDDTGDRSAVPAAIFDMQYDATAVSRAEIASAFWTGRYTAQARFGIPRMLPPGALAPEGYSLVREEASAYGRFLHLERAGHAGVVINSYQGHTSVLIAGVDHAVVARLWTELRAAAARLLDEHDIIPCQLWSSGGNSADSSDHEVPARPWSAIRRNYPDRTAAQLDRVMALRDPTTARGRLLLWHGPAGTGKTSAVTALMTEWFTWCAGHIIADPEQLFQSPNYLLQVSGALGRLPLEAPLPRHDEPWPAGWKLIICEDADEYLRSDARSRSGPALGRLLNLTDGLLGRGADTIVLLTTNDEVGRLHPAVTRPGRCLAAVEFPSLNGAEADRWCPPGITAPAEGATLAELYALAAGDLVDPDVDATGLYL